MTGKVSRRGLLKVLGASSVGSLTSTALPGCLASDAESTSPPAFFDDAERRAVGAFANVILPPEPGTSGGADLGAVAYIERLLTAFEVDPPALFADGPYSGRQPLPDGKGGAGALPPNDFVRFQPIDRVTERSWRIRLYGSVATPGGTLNEAITAPVIGLRDLFKNGMRAAMADAKVPIESLPPDQLRDLFAGLDNDLQKAFVELVPQAAFGAPEYGGNPGGAGWKLVHFEGDAQPLGYSLFDESAGVYRERPDAPMSTKDTSPDPAPLDDATRTVLAQVVAFTDGKVFP